MTDDDEHPYNFGALPPLPDGFSVVYNDNIEHYYATGPDEWESVITVDPYQARKWCFVEAFKRARTAPPPRAAGAGRERRAAFEMPLDGSVLRS